MKMPWPLRTVQVLLYLQLVLIIVLWFIFMTALSDMEPQKELVCKHESWAAFKCGVLSSQFPTRKTEDKQETVILPMENISEVQGYVTGRMLFTFVGVILLTEAIRKRKVKLFWAGAILHVVSVLAQPSLPILGVIAMGVARTKKSREYLSNASAV